jgi:hypothetical protein
MLLEVYAHDLIDMRLLNRRCAEHSLLGRAEHSALDRRCAGQSSSAAPGEHHQAATTERAGVTTNRTVDAPLVGSGLPSALPVAFGGILQGPSAPPLDSRPALGSRLACLDGGAEPGRAGAGALEEGGSVAVAPACAAPCARARRSSSYDKRASIRAQVEYYFSDPSDLFLKEALAAEPDPGYVRLELLGTFPRIARMRLDETELAEALRGSSALELSADCRSVRMRLPATMHA